MKTPSMKFRNRRLCSWYLVTGSFWLVWFSVCDWGAAKEPMLEVDLDNSEIFIGETVTLQVSVVNAKNPSAPDITPLEDLFLVAFRGEQSLNQSSTVVINGRVSQQSSLKHIYQYQLTPKKGGELTVPALTANVDGTTIVSLPVRLKVSEPEPQEDVIAEVTFDSAEIFPTQSCTVTLKVLVKSLPDSKEDPLIPLRRRPPHLAVPWIETPDGLTGPDQNKWLRNLLSDRGVGFTLNEFNMNSGFIFDEPRAATFDLLTGKESRVNQEGKQVEYFRYELSQKLTANRPGTYTFGPCMVKGTFVVGSSGGDYRGKKIAAIAAEQTLIVKEVPTPRPQNFIGGIGGYRVGVTASPLRLRVGDPMTLTIDVAPLGESSSLSLVSAPDLSSIPELVDGFEIIDKNPVGRVEGSNKLFSYGLRPKRMGVAVPEMTFSTFDPRTATFQEIRSSSVPLEIVESKSLDAREIVGATKGPPVSVQADRSGIYQGTIEMYPLRNDRPAITTWVGVGAGSWILVLAASVVWRVFQSQPGASKRTSSSTLRSNALHQFSQARELANAGDNQQSLALVRRAIVDLISELTQIRIEGATTGNIIDSVRALNASEEIQKSVRELLDSIDAVQYGANSETGVMNLTDQAESLCNLLLESWGAKNAKRGYVANRTASTLLIAFLFVGWFAETSYGGQEVEAWKDTFASAVDKIHSASQPDEFIAAARSLAQIKEAGIESGSLYFQMGNAWFRAGQYGRALYCYRIAKFYLPLDPYLSANLDQAILMAPGATKGEEADFVSRILFWSPWTSYPAKLTAATICVSISAFLMGAALLFPSTVLTDGEPSVPQRKRRLCVGASLVLLSIGLLVGIEGWLRSPDAFIAKNGIIAEEATARKGMGDGFAPAFNQPLQIGTEFEVLQRTSQWTLGRFANIGDGWVRNDAIAD